MHTILCCVYVNKVTKYKIPILQNNYIYYIYTSVLRLYYHTRTLATRVTYMHKVHMFNYDTVRIVLYYVL